MTHAALRPAALRRQLTTSTLGRRLYYMPAVDSTNRVAVELAALGEFDGAIVTTDQQTRGRGRQGRTWVSAPGKDLAFSLILRPQMTAGTVLPITLGFSVAIAAALSELAGEPFQVKWPNDVTTGGRKVCGILSESATAGARTRHVVVGIGINVNTAHSELPPAIRDTATTLSAVAQHRFDLASVLGRLLASLEGAYDRFCSGGFAAIKSEYLQRLSMRGERVRFESSDGLHEAIVRTVADDGALVVGMDDGAQRLLYDEEVHFVGS